MRRGFLTALTEIAKADKNVILLTGDLGFKVFEEFAKELPDQYLNCGVAEQNMMGVAAGLAMSGKIPYVYSIVPFATLRCLEQIRADVCYQNLNVKVIGVGGGFSYGELGSTHAIMEDLAVLRALPNMTVLSGADIAETEALMHLQYKHTGPSYLRLCNAGNYKIHDSRPRLEIGKPEVLKDGKDALVIGIGLQSVFCLELAKELKDVDLKVVNIHTLKPIDTKAFLQQAQSFEKIFTVEEHGVIGGLGSAVAELLAQSDWQGKLHMLGMADMFSPVIGSSDYLRSQYGLDKGGIKKIILENIKK